MADVYLPPLFIALVEFLWLALPREPPDPPAPSGLVLCGGSHGR